jgi:hypothetical protein
MIDKFKAEKILKSHNVCTIWGGYGMGLCAFAGMRDVRPVLGLWNASDVPTEEELAKLRSFQEFKIRSYYTETWTQKMLAMNPPCDEGCNTLVFWKGFREQPDVWAYRRITWDHGPTFVDRKKNHQRFRRVEDMFGAIDGVFPEKFREWKQKHLAVFA